MEPSLQPLSPRCSRRSNSRLEFRRLDRHELDHEVIWLFTSLGMALCGAAWLYLGLPRPACHFREALGIPCPTCGATRATMEIMQGDVLGALLLNPLYTAGLALILVYDLYAATVLFGRLPRLRFTEAAGLALLRWAIIAVVLINWGWLIYRGV